MSLTNIPVIIQITNKLESMPGRNYKSIGCVPLFEYTVRRIVDGYGENAVAALSDEPEDDGLAEDIRKLGVSVFRGSLVNVPERLLGIAELKSADSFIRVFGNYPFTDIESLRQLAVQHVEGGFDYSYNGHRCGVIWGTECEVVSAECLRRLVSDNITEALRHSFGYYIRQNSSVFKVLQAVSSSDSPRKAYRLNIETEKDVELANDIVAHVPGAACKDIAAYLDDHPVLAKSNRDEPAKEVGLDKLFLYPKKLEGYLSGNDFAYPISVELSLTNRCNLRCTFCSDEDLRARQGAGATLDKSALLSLFRDLAKGGTRGVVIEGGGEPTLHPDFEKIVIGAAREGLSVGLITNGTAKISPKTLSELSWIRVSLDASTSSEYLKLKGVDKFETVLANIQLYNKYCPTVGVGYVVTRNNMSSLEPLVLRLRTYKIAYVQFRPVVDCPELAPGNEDISYLRYYQGESFGVVVDGMEENKSDGNFGLPCKCHSLTSVISADGSVYICGRLNIYDWLEPIGNIKSEPYREIWHGKTHVAQVQMVDSAKFCLQNCPQCRISKYNKFIDRLNQVNTKNFI